jgi:ubiquinone biosynthesis protein UbiJ
MLSEYWQEEMPLIAKKRQVEAFNSDVDTLRADLARFEKKFAKLQQQLNEHAADKGSQA